MLGTTDRLKYPHPPGNLDVNGSKLIKLFTIGVKHDGTTSRVSGGELLLSIVLHMVSFSDTNDL